jgi:hypothetical protein
MDEKTWLECDDPVPMLEFLRGRGDVRKRRLFACACCRLVWSLLPSDAWRAAVEVAERYADGAASRAERAAVVAAAEGERGAPLAAMAAAHACYADASLGNARGAAVYAAELDVTIPPQEAALVRCVFGNPFRPVALDPAWRTPTALKLAQAIYDDRAFDRLPILADALEEAGCTNAVLLNHCRGAWPHALGCWAVDLLLRKE